MREGDALRKIGESAELFDDHSPLQLSAAGTYQGAEFTLVGPIIGAFFVNGAKSWFTQAFPEFWLYFLGALFIAVTIFLPQGIIGLVRRKKEAS